MFNSLSFSVSSRSLLGLSLCAVLIGPEYTEAQEALSSKIYFQPRVEFGVLDYSHTRDAFVNAEVQVLLPSGPQAQRLSMEKFTFSDMIPFIGVGATVFVDRFYFDVNAIRDLGGETDVDVSAFIGSTNNTLLDAVRFDMQSDRLTRRDYNLAVGYATPIDGLSVFAGYRQGKLEATFDDRWTASRVTSDDTDTQRYTAIRRFHFDLEQKGPFVGLSYAWPVETRHLNGVLSSSFAVGFLDGEIDQRAEDSIVVESDRPGVPVGAPAGDSSLANDRITGDTIGVTLGVKWSGTTPVDNLFYSLGIAGYRFDFSATDATIAKVDFSETQITYKLGLSYLF